jgi:hypothetical protein
MLGNLYTFAPQLLQITSAINYFVNGRLGVTEILVILAIVLLILEVKKFLN